MAAEEQDTPRCELDSNGCIQLSSILLAFSAPINEEHAWALCYQTAKCMYKEWTTDNSNCYSLTDTNQLRIFKDGTVHSSTVRYVGPGPTREVATTEYKLVSSLGLITFHALDYSIQEYEERTLSPPLEMLIDRMTSADPDEASMHDNSSNSGDEDGDLENPDEGIEKDSCEDDPSEGDPGGGGGDGKDSKHRNGLTLSKVMEMCAAHLTIPSQADSHYKAVCRALVAEGLELSSFLQKISKGTKELLPNCPDEPDTSTLDDLRFQDWARLWMQVIRELRQGVKLKKVDNIGPHPHQIEFELTPYEMLLDDIRSRRYKLNKVMVNGDLPPRVKKDAHALILEFIRSRPPLVPASRRKLKPLPPKQPTLYEKLMASIRQQHSLKPVSNKSPSDFENSADVHVKLQENVHHVETSRTKLEDSDTTPQPRRRLIKADLSLRLSMSFDEDDLDDLPSSPTNEQPHSLPVQLSQAQKRPSRLSWQTSTSDVTTATLKQKLERRHSITVCESPSKPQQGSLSREGSLTNGHSEVTTNGKHSHPEGFSLAQWEKSIECLSLTLEEVVHIRNVLTKAELETLLVNRPLYEDVEKRKICFTCKKTRFSFFGTWGVKCKLCERTICDKCSTKMHIPTDRFDKIPVYMLSPSPTPPLEEESHSHTFFQLPAVFQFTSGSAPNSPNLNARPKTARTQNHTNPKTSQQQPPRQPQTTPRGRNQKLRHSESFSVGSLKLKRQESDFSSLPPIVKRAPLLRSKTIQHKSSSPVEEKLRGPLVTVCRDCKAMIRHIILASRTVMAKSQRKSQGTCRLPQMSSIGSCTPSCLSPVTQSPSTSSDSSPAVSPLHVKSQNRSFYVKCQ